MAKPDQSTGLIECQCGEQVPLDKARCRSAAGYKLKKPQCQTCNEREMRRSTIPEDFKVLGAPRDQR